MCSNSLIIFLATNFWMILNYLLSTALPPDIRRSNIYHTITKIDVTLTPAVQHLTVVNNNFIEVN